MTNKIIVVDICAHCPLHVCLDNGSFICIHVETEGMDVTNAICGEYIHKKCPLANEV